MFQNVHELDDFDQMVRDGYIKRNMHPNGRLVIYNYTSRTQYDHKWNPATLACRGLICDLDGNVVARPFGKFFNLDEMKDVPEEPFEVFEKLDGSLAILYHYCGRPYIATRGSFDSPQARWSNVWLRANMPPHLDETRTYLFEIIAPDFRNIVHYGDLEGLFLLGVIDTVTGKELPIDNLGMVTAKRIEGKGDFGRLKDEISKSHEGYVIRFAGGTRAKIKSDEYIRLHAIAYGMDEKYILDAVINGDDIAQAIDGVPDEFNDWIAATAKKFHKHYADTLAETRRIVAEVLDLPTRREQAAVILKSRYKAAAFAMLDGKNYEREIWKLASPQKGTARQPWKRHEGDEG